MKQITIAGNIGKDAEIRTTQGGDKLAGFSVAVSGFKQSDPTTWFDCTIFGKRAEKVAQYIRKGEKITVTGEFGSREHNGKTYFSVRVSDFTLQGGSESHGERSGAASRQNTGGHSQTGTAPAGGVMTSADFDDAMPFHHYPWSLA